MAAENWISREFYIPSIDRMIPISEEFKHYAWFSVQVDQYYSMVRIFARHHGALRAAYSTLPSREDWPRDFSGLSGPAQGFFQMAAHALGSMGTTRIFDAAPSPQLANRSEDMTNFGFYTCFCFQWTLFENFVKNAVLALAYDGLLDDRVARNLRSRERQTARFLSYINDGHVFGDSPFTAVLPVWGWIAQTETCDYSDLDGIRELRNEFIHGVSSTSILPLAEMEKDRLYERSMWILRKFAEHVEFGVGGIRQAAASGG